MGFDIPAIDYELRRMVVERRNGFGSWDPVREINSTLVRIAVRDGYRNSLIFYHHRKLTAALSLVFVFGVFPSQPLDPDPAVVPIRF